MRVSEPHRERQQRELLLRRKIAGGEASEGERLPALHDYLAEKFAQFEREPVDEEATRYDATPLNELFRSSLDEVWELRGCAFLSLRRVFEKFFSKPW